MRALLTGGTGYIGRHLATRLKSEGNEVHLLARASSDRRDVQATSIVPFDSLDPSELEDILSRIRPDVVFHLAAMQRLQHVSDDIRPMIEANILLGTLLAEASASAGVDGFVNVGSISQRYEDRPYSPTCLYGATKQAFVDLLAYYVELRHLPAITIELPDTYGPADPRPKLLSLLAEAQATGRELAVSPGEQILDLLHVYDVVDGLMAAAELVRREPAHAGRTYALHALEQRALRDVVAVWEQVTSTKAPVVFGGRPYREREMMAPTSTATLPGWKPKLDLHTGLRQVLENRGKVKQ